MGKSKNFDEEIAQVINWLKEDMHIEEIEFRLDPLLEWEKKMYDEETLSMILHLKEIAFKKALRKNNKESYFGLLLLSYLVENFRTGLIFEKREEFELLKKLLKRYINKSDSDSRHSLRVMVFHIITFAAPDLAIYEDIAAEVSLTILNAILSGSINLHECIQNFNIVVTLNELITSGSWFKRIAGHVFNEEQVGLILNKLIGEINRTKNDEEYLVELIRLLSYMVMFSPYAVLPYKNKLFDLLERNLGNEEILEIIVEILFPSVPSEFWEGFPIEVMKQLLSYVLSRKKLSSSFKKNFGKSLREFLKENMYLWDKDIVFTNLCFDFIKSIWLNKSSKEHKRITLWILNFLIGGDVIYAWDDLFIQLKSHLIDFLRKNYSITDIWYMIANFYYHRYFESGFLRETLPFLEKFLEQRKNLKYETSIPLLIALILSLDIKIRHIEKYISDIILRKMNDKISIGEVILLLVLDRIGRVKLRNEELDEIKAELLNVKIFDILNGIYAEIPEYLARYLSSNFYYYPLIGSELLKERFSADELQVHKKHLEQYFKKFPSHREHFDKIVKILKGNYIKIKQE